MWVIVARLLFAPPWACAKTGTDQRMCGSTPAKSKPDYTGALEVGGHFALRVTSDQVDRALLLLETLARACEKRGFLAGPRKAAWLSALGVKVWLQTKEKLLKRDTRNSGRTLGGTNGSAATNEHPPAFLLFLRALPQPTVPHGPFARRRPASFANLGEIFNHRLSLSTRRPHCA